ncbi:MAG: sulfotransferase domain-containing protein [Anaerolineales bacterium]
MDLGPILVTGAHRSGTTWVGKMLSTGREIAYISEPLNVWHRPGVMRAPTQYWYTYITQDNQKPFEDAFKEMLKFQYHTRLELKSLRSAKDFFRMVRDWWIFWEGRRYSQRPLIKDPFALFSVEWFVKTLECKVVIVVRHPAAVVSSLSRLGWDFDFSDFLNQPLLMRDWLKPFHKEMDWMRESIQDVIERGSLLWKMLYKVVSELKERQPDIILLRHEDLSKDPINEFMQVYDQLGIKFLSANRQAIDSSSSEKNPKEISTKNVHSVRIDSQVNIKSWQNRLSAEEIDRIYHITQDVAAQYYSEDDWR